MTTARTAFRRRLAAWLPTVIVRALFIARREKRSGAKPRRRSTWRTPKSPRGVVVNTSLASLFYSSFCFYVCSVQLRRSLLMTQNGGTRSLCLLSFSLTQLHFSRVDLIFLSPIKRRSGRSCGSKEIPKTKVRVGFIYAL